MSQLIKFLSPYKGRICIMILLLFIQVIGTLYIPTLTADIVNNGIAAGNLDYVLQTGGFMLAVALATAVFSICGTFTSTYIATALGKDIRGALFRKAQDFSVNDFNRFGAASPAIPWPDCLLSTPCIKATRSAAPPAYPAPCGFPASKNTACPTNRDAHRTICISHWAIKSIRRETR